MRKYHTASYFKEPTNKRIKNWLISNQILTEKLIFTGKLNFKSFKKISKIWLKLKHNGIAITWVNKVDTS